MRYVRNLLSVLVALAILSGCVTLQVGGVSERGDGAGNLRADWQTEGQRYGTQLEPIPGQCGPVKTGYAALGFDFSRYVGEDIRLDFGQRQLPVDRIDQWGPFIIRNPRNSDRAVFHTGRLTYTDDLHRAIPVEVPSERRWWRHRGTHPGIVQVADVPETLCLHFPFNEGWRLGRTIDAYWLSVTIQVWRHGRWETIERGRSIAESNFVISTPDGLLYGQGFLVRVK